MNWKVDLLETYSKSKAQRAKDSELKRADKLRYREEKKSGFKEFSKKVEANG